MNCSMCGDPIPEEKPPGLVVAGGWCIPSEALYDFAAPDPKCSDCNARWLMVMELGIDPGRHGENLKVPRGGIKYTKEK